MNIVVLHFPTLYSSKKKNAQIYTTLEGYFYCSLVTIILNKKIKKKTLRSIYTTETIVQSKQTENYKIISIRIIV